MTNIKYTLGVDGYLNNYALLGDLPGSKEVDLEIFEAQFFDCYHEDAEGNLVLDPVKKDEKLNPPIKPVEPSLQERVEELEVDNADLWHENMMLKSLAVTNEQDNADLWHENMMLKKAVTINEQEIADLWYHTMMGGQPNV